MSCGGGAVLTRRRFVAASAAASASLLVPGCMFRGKGRVAEADGAMGPVVSPGWIDERLESEDVVLVDVRDDAHFDGNLIPGAVRLPWTLFREEGVNSGERWQGSFVGVDMASELLGNAGVSRESVAVFYDDLDRDAGATASYLYWVVDYLGGTGKVLLPGVEGWSGEAVGEGTVKEPTVFEPRVRPGRLVTTDYLEENYEDLQILDVRSREEYNGTIGEGFQGGHIPGSKNVPYEENRLIDGTLKPGEELERLYSALSKDDRTVVYCNSGRRASYTYTVLRYLGFEASLYDDSWNRWGLKEGDRPNVYPLHRGEPNDETVIEGTVQGTRC